MVKSVDPELAQAARDYLAAKLALKVTGLQDVVSKIVTDAWIGGSVVAGGSVLPSVLEVGGSWDGYTPGWAGAAAQISDPGLSAVLDDLGLTIKGLADTTIDQLGTQLAAGIAAGDSMDAIATSLADFLGGDTDRAFTIADTEAARAATAASNATYLQNGVELVDWMLAEGAEELCQDLAANGPYAPDEYPDLPHPRCRCSPSPHFDDADSGVATDEVADDEDDTDSE